jgi:RNase P/RNase MRP subunit POP5
VRLVRVEVDKQQAALPVAGEAERKRVTLEVTT